MKSQSRKAKGRVLQKFVAKKIVEINPELQEDDVVSRPMGSSGIDVMMSPKAQRFVRLSIECKNTVAVPSSSAMEQARYNCYPGTFPVVAWKPKGKPMEETLVMIKLDDLLKLIRELNEDES